MRLTKPMMDHDNAPSKRSEKLHTRRMCYVVVCKPRVGKWRSATHWEPETARRRSFPIQPCRVANLFRRHLPEVMSQREIVLWAPESVPLGEEEARTAAAAVARRGRTHLVVATSGMRSAPKLEHTEPSMDTG